MEKQLVTITEERYYELTMLELKNQMLTRRINELLIEISELQELLNQKVILPTKKNKSKINATFFKE
jgi:hypothetical protein